MAAILGLTGVSLIWSAIYFSWAIQHFMDAPIAPGETDPQFVPVPITGVIALYYLIGRFGVAPALSIMFGVGCVLLIPAYVVVRRFR